MAQNWHGCTASCLFTRERIRETEHIDIEVCWSRAEHRDEECGSYYGSTCCNYTTGESLSGGMKDKVPHELVSRIFIHLFHNFQTDPFGIHSTQYPLIWCAQFVEILTNYELTVLKKNKNTQGSAHSQRETSLHRVQVLFCFWPIKPFLPISADQSEHHYQKVELFQNLIDRKWDIQLACLQHYYT